MKESSQNDSPLRNNEFEISKILSPNASEKKENKEKHRYRRKSSFSPKKKDLKNQNSSSLHEKNLAKYLNSPEKQNILLNSTEKHSKIKKQNKSRFI